MKSLSRSLQKIQLVKHNSRILSKLALMLLVAPCLPAVAGWMGDSRPLMGTEVSVLLWSDDDVAGREALEAVFLETARINGLMSTYLEDSEISRVNRLAACRPVSIGDELSDVIRQALDISALTQGAFDISYDSVGQHYDFGSRQRPDSTTLERERDFIDYRNIDLDQASGTIKFLKEGVRINLGGIAKGYAVERGVDILRHRGIEHAIVTAGGDSRLLGDRRGRPWMVGIRNPRGDDERQVAISVPLVDEAISTSGDYERFFDEDGVRYHHIIKPSTGEPVGGVHSVTVFGPDAVITDALSTSVFVLGVESGLTLIATLPEYESIVIDAAGRVFYSDGLETPAPAADE